MGFDTWVFFHLIRLICKNNENDHLKIYFSHLATIKINLPYRRERERERERDREMELINCNDRQEGKRARCREVLN